MGRSRNTLRIFRKREAGLPDRWQALRSLGDDDCQVMKDRMQKVWM
jgi:hypothetical protein